VNPAGAPPWVARRERGSDFALWLMARISLLAGRRASRVVLRAIALYFLVVAGGARRASLGYLSRVLGRRARWSDAYRHLFTFATTIHDRVYLLHERSDLFDIRIRGADALHEAAGRGGILLFGAHLGSFELLRSAARLRPGLRLCMAMYPDNARRIGRALAAINPRLAPDILPLGRLDAMIRVHERLEAGTMVGLLADRGLRADAMAQAPFLGEPAKFPEGPFRMAALLRRPVFFVAGLHRGGNRYEVRFEALAPRPGDEGLRFPDGPALLARYVEALERHCREAPLNWFNFYDFWSNAPDE